MMAHGSESNNTYNIKLKNGDKDQQLFWKVFRNTFLFKKIMSNMDTHLSTPYNSIISITNMIKCNQLNLLRDKVIRNQYLSFSIDYGKFNEIFDAIKNDDDKDRLFYQQLFKHYSQYSMDFNNVKVRNGVLIDIGNGREILANDIIESNCIPALQVLIQHYQYIPTIDNLSKAINKNSFKLVKLLLQPQFNLQISTLVKYITNIKILNYINDEKLIDIQIVEERLNEIISNLNIGECNLKSLIIISKLISKSINQNDGNNNDNNTNIVSIEEIESFSNLLTKQELKSTLSDKSNQIKSKKEMIKKLLQLLYSFSKVKKSQFYYIYFSGDDETYTESDIGVYLDKKEEYKSFLRFADLTLVPPIDNYSSELASESFDSIQSNVNEPDLLFSHCQDKEKQMKFLNFNIGKFKEGATLIDKHILFYFVIYNDNLDQIKYFTYELGDHIKECSNRVSSYYRITSYIRSTLVLEWLFENYYSYFIVGGAANWYFKSVELLQHYEKLYQLKYKPNGNENNNSLILLSIPFTLQDEYYGNHSCNIDVLKHIFKSGSNVYQKELISNGDNEIGINSSYLIFTTVIYSTKCSSYDKFELLKLAYLNFGSIDQLISFEDSEYGAGIYENSFIRFIDWFYRNYQDEFNSSEKLKDIETIKSVLIKIGVYIDTDIKSYSYISLSDPNECKTQILDIILKNIQHPLYKVLVNEILSNACENGKFETIKYIHQNYNWLLIEKSKSNPNGIFTTEELNILLQYSLECNQLVVSDYLFDLLFSLTKSIFDNNAGNLSKLYYRNKSFK